MPDRTTPADEGVVLRADRELIERDLLPDFNMVHLSGWATEANPNTQAQFASKFVQQPAVVATHTWFARIRVVTSRPSLHLQLWREERPTEPAIAPNGHPWKLVHQGRLQIPGGFITLFSTTAGGLGEANFMTGRTKDADVTFYTTDRDTARSEFRQRVLAGDTLPVDVECWLLQILPRDN